MTAGGEAIGEEPEGAEDGEDGEAIGEEPEGSEPATFDDAPTSITIELETGPVAVELLEAGFIEEEIPSNVGGVVEPQGTVYAIRYSLANEGNVEMQPSFHFSDNVTLTDGERMWTFALGMATDVAFLRDDEQPATYIGAGLTGETWMAFDVPPDAEPVGILHTEPNSGNVVALSLP